MNFFRLFLERRLTIADFKSLSRGKSVSSLNNRLLDLNKNELEELFKISLGFISFISGLRRGFPDQINTLKNSKFKEEFKEINKKLKHLTNAFLQLEEYTYRILRGEDTRKLYKYETQEISQQYNYITHTKYILSKEDSDEIYKYEYRAFETKESIGTASAYYEKQRKDRYQSLYRKQVKARKGKGVPVKLPEYPLPDDEIQLFCNYLINLLGESYSESVVLFCEDYKKLFRKVKRNIKKFNLRTFICFVELMLSLLDNNNCLFDISDLSKINRF